MNHETIVPYFLAMIRPLLAEPDKAECVATKDDMGVLLTVRVSPPDFGRLIGKNGTNIEKFRSIIRTIGLTHGMRASVKVAED